MQIIYKATHLPTNKPYIGYKADADKLSSYKTSSKVVNPMMTANPHEWEVEPIVFILPGVSQIEAVRLEQEVIKQYLEELGGWNGIWNKTIGYGFENLFAPEALERRASSLRTPEARQANRQRTNAQFAKPGAREAASLKSIEQFAKPGALEAMSQRTKKQMAKPGAKELASKKQKEFNANNPETLKAVGLKRKEFWATNLAAVEVASKKSKEHAANPEVKKAQSKRATEQWSHPEARVAMSKTKEKYHANNPGAAEINRQKILKVQGKKIEATFDNGETITHLGGKELGEILGAWNLRKMANGKSHRRKDGTVCPITCTAPAYAGRKIISARYV